MIILRKKIVFFSAYQAVSIELWQIPEMAATTGGGGEGRRSHYSKISVLCCNNLISIGFCRPWLAGSRSSSTALSRA